MSKPVAPKRTLRNYALSAIFGTIGGLLTIGTIIVLDSIISLIWTHGFGMNVDDPSRTIASLVMLLVFGVVIGLFAKRFGGAKGSIETVIEESLTQGYINWRLAAKNVFVSLISIGSGASLGPEAPAAMVTAGTASFIAQKASVDNETSTILNLSSVAGMLGALLSSPFVALSMFIEFSKQSLNNLRDVISYGLIAGSFGLATFFAIFHKFYVIEFGIPAYAGPTMIDLTKSLAFGLIGALFAVIIGLVMRRLEPVFVKLDKKVFIKSLVGAFVAGCIAFALPLTMFSGQHTLGAVVGNAATMSILMLLALAVGKILSTTILLRTGFFGGPIFPAIFAGAALGIASNGLFDAPMTVAIAATTAGMITVMLRAPLSAAIVTIAIMGTSSVAPTAIGVCAGLIIVSLIEQKMAEATNHAS